jgi:outer membrane lipoprotein-sorting protein
LHLFEITRCSRKALNSFAILLLVFTSCNRVQYKSVDSTPTKEVFSSTPPFKTNEPESYQAIRVVTFTGSDRTSEVSRTLLAKDGLNRREETLGPGSIVYLYVPQGSYILVPQAQIYADSNPGPQSTPVSTPPDEASEPILRESGSETLYRQLGSEDINGRRLQRYQIVVNTSPGQNVTTTETTVWVDEELGMPIKQEIRSGNGKTVIELTEVSRNVDKKLFQIPGNYRKVSREELEQALSRK